MSRPGIEPGGLRGGRQQHFRKVAFEQLVNSYSANLHMGARSVENVRDNIKKNTRADEYRY
jgi:hypothetical protein